MKFLKEKFDQFGKPLLLWFFSYKIFQSWANPEKQSKLTKFLIDDVFFKIFMYLVWAYATFILFIVYSLPTPPYLLPFLDIVIEQLPPLESRVRTLHSFLFYVPGPYDLWIFSVNVIDFLKDIVFVFSTLIFLPFTFQKFFLLKLLDHWLGPTLDPFFTKLYEYTGFSSDIEKNSHNLFLWLLLKNSLGKEVGLKKHPFYPLILIELNKAKHKKWEDSFVQLPKAFQLVWEIKYIKADSTPLVFSPLFCTEFHFIFFLWTRGSMYPQESFTYLFNQNRYLMARFISFSTFRDDKNFDDNTFEKILKDFYILDSYESDIKKDFNWSTMEEFWYFRKK